MKKEKAFTHLASIYDRMMNHVDYRRWGLYIKKIIKLQSFDTPVSVLHLTCGTGNILRYLNDDKISIAVCDRSWHMLQIARTKIFGDMLPIFVSDARRIATGSNKFDVILMLYDSVNYIIDEVELNKCFADIWRVLTQRGIFIFDTVTESHCLKYYKNEYYEEEWGESGYYRHSYYSKKPRLQRTDFNIIVNNIHFIENHIQRIYPLQKLQGMLRINEFSLSGLYDGYSFKQGTEKSERVHFLARKVT